jgi:low temperature requirement protein LtrA
MTDRARTRLHAPEAQGVTFVELFFDLVFVFAVTQVTALTAHNLTPDGVLRSLVLFWLIWWAWTQFTWTLNPADTTHVVVRVITLAATAAAFVMATTVSQAFLDDGVWFAIPYLVVRILGLSLQVLVEIERTDDLRAAGIWRWAGVSGIGLALVLLGALADPSIRPLIWVLAILTDLLATQAARGRTWDIHVGHIAERHALFVIIALGESLIVAGTAVAAQERTVALAADSALALLIACLLWWTYFGWFKEGLEEQVGDAAPRDVGVRVRDAYSLGHFPMLSGIIGFAVGIEEIVAHPGDPLHTEVLIALGSGVALFVGFSAIVYWRISGAILVARVVAVFVIAAGLVLVGSLPPAWPLAVVAIALTVVVVWEHRRPPVGEPIVADDAAFA